MLTLIGSFGLFFTLFLLFCRYLPMVAMAEVKTVMPHADAHAHDLPTSTCRPAAFVRLQPRRVRPGRGAPVSAAHTATPAADHTPKLRLQACWSSSRITRAP
jgi:hypothetical protein